MGGPGNTIPLTPITSRMLFATGYADGRLALQFKANGVIYHYPMTPEVYAEFEAAPSKGGYFAANIRGKVEHVDKFLPDPEAVDAR